MQTVHDARRPSRSSNIDFGHGHTDCTFSHSRVLPNALNMSSRIAVILGAGPGLSASVARKLLTTHNVVLLSRSMPGALSKLNLDAPEKSILAAPSDGSRDSLDAAIKEAKAKWPNATFDVGVFNVGGNFSPGPFLEKSEKDLRTILDSGV